MRRRHEQNKLERRPLSLASFFDAVRNDDGLFLRKRGNDILVCNAFDVKAQFPRMIVKDGAVLPENSLFSRGERKEIAHLFRDLEFKAPESTSSLGHPCPAV